jgi:TatD DNase family protein
MPDAYPDGGVGAVTRAIEAGVTRLVFPCVNLGSLPDMRRLHEEFPENTRLALGLHPTDLSADWQSDLDKMEAMLPGDFAAIGEVGIDLYHDASMREEQRVAFARQIGWAQRFGLPVIIHCREGLDDTLRVLSGTEGKLPPLVFHSFTGTADDVRRIRTVCDPWFGINGVVTFKNAPLLREALPEIGLDRILLETDSPWLSPAPKRGQTNESARIPYIRDCVATTLGVTPEEVERVTDEAAEQLFFTRTP